MNGYRYYKNLCDVLQEELQDAVAKNQVSLAAELVKMVKSCERIRNMH